MHELPYKHTSTLSFHTPLAKYIGKQYGDCSRYEEDLHILDSLRKEATTEDITVGSTNHMWKYYWQLSYLQSRFIFDENNIKISFTWKNAFPKDSRAVSSYALNFEKAAVLFNLAVLLSRWPELDAHDGETLKIKANNLMKAAGVIDFIASDLVPGLKLPSNTDLSMVNLQCLSKLFLAQAQECFVIKAHLDGMKPATLIKLCASCGDLYRAAYDLIDPSPLAENYGQTFFAEISAKTYYYYAKSHLFKAAENEAAKQFGEQVARLGAAQRILEMAFEFKNVDSKFLFDAGKLQSEIRLKLAEATKMNNLIYYQDVPKEEELVKVGRAELAKPLPIPSQSSMSDIVGAPLFGSLVPLPIHTACCAYNDRKAEVYNSLKAEYGARLAHFNEKLHRMGVMSHIDASEKPIGLPESIKEKSRIVKEKGGPKALSASFDLLASMREDHKRAIARIKQQIDKEKREDDDMRRTFGSKWRRPASNELGANFVEKISKFEQAMRDAEGADNDSRRMWEASMAGILSLSSSVRDLEAAIPSSASSSNSFDRSLVEDLRRAYSECQSLGARLGDELEGLGRMFESDTVLPQLLQTDVSINRDEICSEALKKYDVARQTLEQLCMQQEGAAAKIEESMARFQEGVLKSGSLHEREVAIRTLDNAYDSFEAISSNTEDGLRFYTELGDHLKRLEENVNDFCLCRQIEHRDLLQELQNVSARADNPPLPPRSRHDSTPDVQYPQGTWHPGMPINYANFRK